jgi:hypothetical protein
MLRPTMTNPTTSKNDRIALCRAIIKGLNNHVVASTVLLNGKRCKKAAVIARLERYVAALVEIDRVFAEWRIATTKASRLYFDDIHPLFADMKMFVDSHLGVDRRVQFGFKRAKRGHRRVQDVAAAVDKARASARHAPGARHDGEAPAQGVPRHGRA